MIVVLIELSNYCSASNKISKPQGEYLFWKKKTNLQTVKLAVETAINSLIANMIFIDLAKSITPLKHKNT